MKIVKFTKQIIQSPTIWSAFTTGNTFHIFSQGRHKVSPSQFIIIQISQVPMS